MEAAPAARRAAPAWKCRSTMQSAYPSTVRMVSARRAGIGASLGGARAQAARRSPRSPRSRRLDPCPPRCLTLEHRALLAPGTTAHPPSRTPAHPAARPPAHPPTQSPARLPARPPAHPPTHPRTLERLALGGGGKLAGALGGQDDAAQACHGGLKGQPRSGGRLVEQGGHDQALQALGLGAARPDLLHLPGHLEDPGQGLLVELLALDHVLQRGIQP